MYIIKRVNKATFSVEYLCEDTARKFWLSKPNKKWLLAFASEKEANTERSNAEANGVTIFFYMVDTIRYSQRDKKYIKNRPLSGNPDSDKVHIW